MADSAQSYPLLPTLEPALSIACSIFSVVMIPYSTGIPVARPICAIPFADSLTTKFNW